MRLATITNWAYGATVLLTLASGTTMLLASNAQEKERAAVEQRYQLDRAAETTAKDLYLLSGLARQYAVGGDRTNLIVYQRERAALRQVEARLANVRDTGAGPEELSALREALHWADTLLEEQSAAIAARQAGDVQGAIALVFSPEYERELARIESLIDRFEDRLDRRTEADVAEATRIARLWRTSSEITLGLTALLFLFVLYFVFKRRVLRPVVRLSDVVSRLAAQDYAAEPPVYARIDEIGDMAQAIRVFRENGLARQQLEEERAADSHIRDLLSRMTQRMQGCDTLDDLKGVIERFVPEIVPDMAGRLYILDETRNALVEGCAWGGPAHSQAEFPPLACWALRRGALHRPTGDHVDVPCDHLTLMNGDGALPADTLCLPLVAHRETMGLLYLEPHDGDRRAVPDIYLKMLAENIGLALGNMRLRDVLRAMAMVDPLTGLANRRQLDMTLEQLLADSAGRRSPISALMIDVDHFKRFNDRHGHDAGDTVLREVAAVLRGSMRDGTHAYRHGGEEFLVLMPGFDAAQAMERAEEIRQKVAALTVRHDGAALGAVTISAGLATTPDPVPPHRLIPAADAALYRAKQAGRDRVIAAVERRDQRDAGHA